MRKYDRSEPETIKKTAKKMMFGHLELVDTEKKVYRRMIWNLVILCFSVFVAAMAAAYTGYEEIFIMTLLISLAASCIIYGALSHIRNEIDINLWFAERWRLLRYQCLVVEDSSFRPLADQLEIISMGDCLVEMDQIITDINSYHQRKSNPGLERYLQKRKSRALAKQLIKYSSGNSP